MFITFEGIEGCGKSTQAELLKNHLQAAGKRVVLTKEPGGTRLGTQLRSILLAMDNTDICKETELFLYLADRSQHVHSLIKPALSEGNIVLSDRFFDSMIVYQGYGRGMDVELLSSFNEVAIAGTKPDLTILMDLPAETGLKRALNRNIEQKLTSSEGRFEAESLAFHTRVRNGYLAWAEKNQDRFVVVDASLNVDRIFARILSELNL